MVISSSYKEPGRIVSRGKAGKKRKEEILNHAPAGLAACERAEHALHARVRSCGTAGALAPRSAKIADLEARQRFLLKAKMFFPFRQKKIRTDRWLSPLKGSSPAAHRGRTAPGSPHSASAPPSPGASASFSTPERDAFRLSPGCDRCQGTNVT